MSVLELLLSITLAAGASFFTARSLPLLAAAFRDLGHERSAFRLLSGGLWLIIAGCTLAIALGIVHDSRPTVIVASIILGEELYEVSVAWQILRHGRRAVPVSA